MKTSVILGCVALLSILAARLAAQSVPPLINYQGRLANPDGSPFPTADYELRVAIYDSATDGRLVWGPQAFDGAPGAGHGPRLSVVQGYFNAMLGPVDTLGRSIMEAFGGSNRFVEVTVGNRAPILPRQQILAAPYALVAASVAPGSNGKVRMANSLSFESYADMAIYLFERDVNYGIGIQPDTTYFRTGTGFAWFRNGLHRGSQANDPGPGGTTLMRLDAVGDLHVHGLFQSASDRDLKGDFQEVNPSEILENLASIPIRTWSYTNDSQRARHIGPVAQDFYSAFGVGRDEKKIATVDADGVAFAAIQGLHRLVKEREREIRSLEKSLQLLREEIAIIRTELGLGEVQRRASATR